MLDRARFYYSEGKIGGVQFWCDDEKIGGEELGRDDEKNGGVEIWCNHDINQWRHRLILQRHGAPYPTLMQCHHANQPILKVPIKLSNSNIIPKEPRRRSVVRCCLEVLL